MKFTDKIRLEITNILREFLVEKYEENFLKKTKHDLVCELDELLKLDDVFKLDCDGKIIVAKKH